MQMFDARSELIPPLRVWSSSVSFRTLFFFFCVRIYLLRQFCTNEMTFIYPHIRMKRNEHGDTKYVVIVVRRITRNNAEPAIGNVKPHTLFVRIPQNFS